MMKDNNSEIIMVKCLRCGHSWEPRVKDPVQCPKCKSIQWNTPPREQIFADCLECGHSWIPNVENPKRCPHCKSWNWQLPAPKICLRCLAWLDSERECTGGHKPVGGRWGLSCKEFLPRREFFKGAEPVALGEKIYEGDEIELPTGF